MHKLLWAFFTNQKAIIGISLGVVNGVASAIIPLAVRSTIDLSQSHSILATALLLIFILISQSITAAASLYILSTQADNWICELREKMFAHVVSLPTRFFDNNESGAVASRIVNDVAVLRTFVTSSVPQFCSGVLTIGISFVALTMIDWQLPLILCGVFIIMALTMLFIGKLYKKTGTVVQDRISKITAFTTGAIRSVRAMKDNNAQSCYKSSFKRHANELLDISLWLDRLGAFLSPLQTTVESLMILGIIAYEGYRVSIGSSTTGTMVAFLLYCYQLITPINSIGSFYTGYQSVKGSIQQILTILQTPTEDDEHAPHRQHHAIVESDSQPILSIEHADFSYDKVKVLHDVSLSIRKGERIALVGPTGAGKSTLIKLLMLSYPLDRGKIIFANEDSSEFSLHDWRALFAIASQDPAVISGSLRDNLSFGLTEIPSQESMLSAIHLACLDEILSTRDGLDTMVGEQGVALSSGQRQRLQLARIYLRHPQFIILDEATANLDSNTEINLLSNLASHLGDCGLIAVAHRLSTIQDFDRIYYIEAGNVQAEGTHEELCSTKREYRQMARLQSLQAL
jgi:ATP-binding cassette subfamily B protein AbcA/BmrA